ncbi:unnamed protein product [Vitrella brassicaformis CCMP3155]|uniref:Uncharacterized protein n=1 Tax=Vitrella brassicaformis (strain CCMP3155) TaxID=1169540 RepID=A0A0G4H7L2_VITBC|nr:unnamed protein product [Vitrella brassicaformis CCMP3155]|eukprot:CEM39884.1 unnamed protein product [Vitrella brassicaformis CCMP3155]
MTLKQPLFLDYPIFAADSDSSGYVLTVGGGGGREYGIENQLDLLRVGPSARRRPSVERCFSLPTDTGIFTTVRFSQARRVWVCSVRTFCAFLYVDTDAGGVMNLGEFATDERTRKEQEMATLDPQSRALATVHEDGTLRLWEVEWLDKQPRDQRPSSSAASSSSKPPETLAAALKKKPPTAPFEIKRLHLRHTCRGHESGALDCDFAHDSSLVATTSRDNTFRLWDTQTGEQIAQEACPAPAKAPAGAKSLMPRFCRFFPDVGGPASRKYVLVGAHGARGPTTLTIWRVSGSRVEMVGGQYLADKVPCCSINISGSGWSLQYSYMPHGLPTKAVCFAQ